jgi:hypothetical protein
MRAITPLLAIALMLFLSGCTTTGDTILITGDKNILNDYNGATFNDYNQVFGQTYSAILPMKISDANEIYIAGQYVNKVIAGTNTTVSCTGAGNDGNCTINSTATGGNTYTDVNAQAVISANAPWDWDVNVSGKPVIINCDNNANCTITGKVGSASDINSTINIYGSTLFSLIQHSHTITDQNITGIICGAGQAIQQINTGFVCVDLNSAITVGGTTEFYFYKANSGIADYNVMNEDYNATAQQTYTFVPTASDQNLVAFISPPLGISIIPNGDYEVHIHTVKNSGTKDMKFYGKIYTRDSTGVETLIGTTENSDIFSGTQAQSIHAAADSIAVNPTDRILVKLYSVVTGLGTNPNISLLINGTTVAHLGIPNTVDRNFLYTTFIPYTGATNNLSMPDRNVTANYFIGNGSLLTNLLDTNCAVAGSCANVIYGNYVNTKDINTTGTIQSNVAAGSENLALKNSSDPNNNLFFYTGLDTSIGATTGKVNSGGLRMGTLTTARVITLDSSLGLDIHSNARGVSSGMNTRFLVGSTGLEAAMISGSAATVGDINFAGGFYWDRSTEDLTLSGNNSQLNLSNNGDSNQENVTATGTTTTTGLTVTGSTWKTGITNHYDNSMSTTTDGGWKVIFDVNMDSMIDIMFSRLAPNYYVYYGKYGSYGNTTYDMNLVNIGGNAYQLSINVGNYVTAYVKIDYQSVPSSAISFTNFGTAATIGTRTAENLPYRFGNEVQMTNNNYLSFLTAAGVDDGTRLYKTTANGLQLNYAGNAFIFLATDDKSIVYRNSLGQTYAGYNPLTKRICINCATASTTLDVNGVITANNNLNLSGNNAQINGSNNADLNLENITLTGILSSKNVGEADTNSTGMKLVTLPVAMPDANYFVGLSPAHQHTVTGAFCWVQNRTTANFTARCEYLSATPYIGHFLWMAVDNS